MPPGKEEKALGFYTVRPRRYRIGVLVYFLPLLSVTLHKPEMGGSSMPWIFLLVAGLFEVVWAVCLKLSNGFSRPDYTFYTIIGMIISFYFLAQAMKTIPLGTAYAVWTGIGVIGATILGIILFKESITVTRAFFVLLLLIGIAGLKITSMELQN